jgi:hypothetical protein
MVLIALAAQAAAAQTYFDRILGQRRSSFSARSMALGNTGVASNYGSSAILTNPALLWQAFAPTDRTGTVFADASLAGSRPSENRIFPLLDTFGDIITDNVYATNSPMFGYGDGGALYKAGEHLFVGLGTFAYYTFDYDYKERLSAQLPRSSVNRDPFLDNNLMRSRGTWRTYALSVNQGFGDNIHIGATLNYLSGTGFKDHYRYVTMNSNYSATTDTVDIDRSYGGGSSLNVILGASYRISPNTVVGISWDSPFGMNTKDNSFFTMLDTLTGLPILGYDTMYVAGTSDLTYRRWNVRYRMPWRVGFGVEFRPQNELLSRVVMEVHYTHWSSYRQTFSDSVSAMSGMTVEFDPAFDNTLDFHIGVEHLFFGYVPVRMGFSHLRSPLGGALVTSVFDMGAGFERGPLRFDAALEIANRDYKYRILFPQIASDRQTLDKVEESTVRIMATLSYRFGLR